MRFAEEFWLAFREGRGEEGRFPIIPGSFARRNQDGELQSTPLGDRYIALDGALARLETTLDALKDKPAEVENVVRRIRQAKFDLQFIVTGEIRNCSTDRATGTGNIPPRLTDDVSGLLEDKLFEKVDTVVLTSATLSSAGNFSFIRERLGLNSADDLIAESTFDYQSQRFVSPTKDAGPRSRELAELPRAEVIRIVKATEGRAFVLSTSLAGMQSLYDLAMPELDYPCLLQGTPQRVDYLSVFGKLRMPVICDVQFLQALMYEASNCPA